MIKYNLEEQPIYCIADMHGAFDIVFRSIKESKMENCCLFICGDIGLGFANETKTQAWIGHWNHEMNKKGIHVFMIRGNHDNKKWFDDGVIDFEYIKAIKDYTIVSVGDKNILCVGGAISIDREYRMTRYYSVVQQYISLGFDEEQAKNCANKGYWPDEIPIYDEDALNEITANGIDIQYVVTHTSPTFAFKNDKIGIEGWLSKDENLAEDLKMERNTLSKIYNKIIEDGHNLKAWVYGHFHEHNFEEIKGVKFVALINSDFKLDTYELN